MAKSCSTATAFIAFLSISALLGLQLSSRAANQAPLSAAQVALFESDHLAEIKAPATLAYTFQHVGSEPCQDTVALALSAVHEDGSKDVSVQFLTDERHVEFSPVTRFHGNPLIMYFLEWDVRGMHRATGGSAVYFRNRIREAFIDQAEIAEASITVDGRPEAATTAITLLPYRHDPGIKRYAAFRDKSYRFVLSQAVPGMVYEIEVSLPTGAGDMPAAVDRVTYQGIRE